MILKADEVLLIISHEAEGDWNKMYQTVKEKRPLKSELLEDIKAKTYSKYTCVTAIDFPHCFMRMNMPPILLYYYGNLSLLETPLLAVVGSRHPDEYQKRMTTLLLDEFLAKTENKYGIISGLARGIDQTAMEVAMKHNAPLVGVLGCGIEECYPEENRHIYDYCKINGLLFSEYPGEVEPLSDHFPMRNRLIAAACKAMFIPSGTKRSGTAISARMALENGKEVLALPGDLDKQDFCDGLIHDGATCVTSVDDLIDAMK